MKRALLLAAVVLALGVSEAQAADHWDAGPAEGRLTPESAAHYAARYRHANWEARSFGRKIRGGPCSRRPGQRDFLCYAMLPTSDPDLYFAYGMHVGRYNGHIWVSV